MLSRTFGVAVRTMRPVAQRQIASMPGKDGLVNARRFGGAVVLGSASLFYASDATTSNPHETKQHMNCKRFELVSADTLAWRGHWYPFDVAEAQVIVPHMEQPLSIPKTNSMVEEAPEEIEPESSSSLHRCTEDSSDKRVFQIVSADSLAMRFAPSSAMYV